MYAKIPGKNKSVDNYVFMTTIIGVVMYIILWKMQIFYGITNKYFLN